MSVLVVIPAARVLLLPLCSRLCPRRQDQSTPRRPGKVGPPACAGRVVMRGRSSCDALGTDQVVVCGVLRR